MEELKNEIGMLAWKLWNVMPEPKLNYVDWYYAKREQSLKEALEGWSDGRPDSQ